MNFDGDQECTADYGPFGSNACNCSACRPPVRSLSAADLEIARIHKEKREREQRVSQDFNRHMIDLFNSRTNQ